MTRFASATNETEAAKQNLTMVVLAKLEFASATLYLHDGIGTLTFGGNNYLGVGSFGSIDSADEAIELVAKSLTLTLSGVDSSIVTSAMTENYQNRPVTIYLGFLDSSNAFVATPETVWEGRMNQITVNASKGEGTVKLSCEYRLRREPLIARFSDQDQKLAFPGDRFFDLLHTIPNYVGRWGQRDVRGSHRGGGGSSGGSGSEFEGSAFRAS